ncbi:MAG: hypothetical protein R3B48_26460 [Kofleriaceae bacterium]
MQKPEGMKLGLILLVTLAWCASAYAQPARSVPCHERALGDYEAPGLPIAPLSGAELLLLERGEIPTGRYVFGGIVSSMYGFGIGHAIQKRWTESGWLFTVGEIASLALAVHTIQRASSDCVRTEIECAGQRGYAVLTGLALLSYTGFRIAEVTDSWSAPPHHNDQVRAARERAHRLRTATPYLTPTHDGGMAGFVKTF